MRKLSRRTLGVAFVLLTLVGCSSNAGASVLRGPHQSRHGSAIQNKIDSIQQWAHQYCDSVLNSFRDNFKSDPLEKEYLKDLLKHRLDSLNMNPFFSNPSQPDGSMNDFLFGKDRYGPAHKGPDGRNYFLRIVPGTGGKGIHVEGNLWLLDSEEAAGRFR